MKVFLKDQIINAFKVAFSNMTQKSAILITDDHTTLILDTCLKVHQLNDMGIGAILNVKYKRERVPVPPFYFLSSNPASIKAVVKDYENSKEPQYTKFAHLFICSSITEDCLDMIKNSNLRRHLKTFQEVYCDFHALESRVFHFNRPGAFRNIYLLSNREKELQEMQETAEMLFSVCVSINEHPYIRYTRDSQHAHNLAQMFDKYFRKQLTHMKQFNHEDKRAMLLIVDRTQDPVAPLLHEITYQAMIKDLIPSETKYIPLGDDTADAKTKESARFYYADDPMWADFKHLNLPILLKDMQTKFASFKENNRIARSMLKEQKEDENLLKNVRHIPKYKKMTESFNCHFEIKDKLVGLYRALNLKQIGEIEQSLVTNLDETGRNCRLKDVQTQLSDVLRDVKVGTDIKLRLLLIYIISQGGVKEEKLKNLFNIANLSQQNRFSILNIKNLGVRIMKSDKKTHKSPFYNDMHARAKVLSKSKVYQSRYEPLVATLLRKFDKVQLSPALFPICGEEENRSNITGTFGGRSLKDRAKRTSRNKKSKIIVFVIGGVCYSEIRECYLLSKELKRDIFIGSSHVMSPTEYINLLKGPDSQEDSVIEIKADDEVKQR